MGEFLNLLPGRAIILVREYQGNKKFILMVVMKFLPYRALSCYAGSDSATAQKEDLTGLDVSYVSEAH